MTSPIDALYDSDNDELIVLFNEKGEEIAFEQVALIPIENKIYAILKPARPIEGLGEDEGIDFSIELSDGGEEYLALVTDEQIIDAVFRIYDDLCAQQVSGTEE